MGLLSTSNAGENLGRCPAGGWNYPPDEQRPDFPEDEEKMESRLRRLPLADRS